MTTLDTLKGKLLGSLQSTVMWLNTLSAAIVPGLDYMQGQLPAMQAFMPQHLYVWAFGGLALANMFLRWFVAKDAPLENKPLPQAMLASPVNSGDAT